jgi:hypothetical protein
VNFFQNIWNLLLVDRRNVVAVEEVFPAGFPEGPRGERLILVDDEADMAKDLSKERYSARRQNYVISVNRHGPVQSKFIGTRRRDRPKY